MTEGAEQSNGVVVYSMNEMPLGFGVLARGASKIRDTDPQNIVVINQADVGEYLRKQQQLN